MSAQVLPFLRSAPTRDPQAEFRAARAAFLRAFWQLADHAPATARWQAAEVWLAMMDVLDVGDGA